jgi:hypothetical protein
MEVPLRIRLIVVTSEIDATNATKRSSSWCIAIELFAFGRVGSVPLSVANDV